MIALATYTYGTFGREAHVGVADYARSHSPKRWGDLVVIPMEGLGPGALKRYRLAGLIISVPDEKTMRAVKSLGIPAVNISGMVANPDMPTIVIDNEKVGRTAAAYYLERGYRHFAYVPLAWHQAYSEARGLGFVASVREAGYRAFWHGDWPRNLPDGAMRDTRELTAWLKALPKPVAIFTPQDAAAIPVYDHALAAGLSVPDQVAILGVDNEPQAHFFLSGISSIDVPVRQLGYQAAALLDKMLSGKQPERRMTRVPPGEVFTRATTDIRAIDDAEVIEALRYIREHACDGICIEDITGRVSAGLRTLQRRFSSVLGTTMQDEIRRVRVARARKLLVTTKMRIEEVAAACGFTDRNRFFVAFRALTGMSPSRFRATEQETAPSHAP